MDVKEWRRWRRGNLDQVTMYEKKFKKESIKVENKNEKVSCDRNVLHIFFLIKHRVMATILLRTLNIILI